MIAVVMAVERRETQMFIKLDHSTLSGIEIELKKLSTGPSLGERACIRGSEYILFKILDLNGRIYGL